MFRLAETNIAKETFYIARNPITISDVNIDSIVISKLIETKTNFKYLIAYLDKVVRPSVLVLSKISEYVKKFKVKDKNNNLMSFHIDDESIRIKYKAIWIKLKIWWKIKIDDDRYIKNKIKTYSDKVYTDFRGLTVSGNYIEC